MLYSDSESVWLNRRAERIAQERGWPLPVARSEAEAELTRGRASGHRALVVPIRIPCHAAGTRATDP